MDNELKLQTQFVEEKPLVLTLKSGRKIIISINDLDFFNQLRSKLDDEEKIQVFAISITSMEQYIQTHKKDLIDELIALSRKKYYFRDTGDYADLNDSSICQSVLNLEEEINILTLRKQIKKGIYNYEKLTELLEEFKNGNQIYRK